jgi:hypothetical protein
MDVEQELYHMKLDDEALGMNKIQVICRLRGTKLGFKEELCSLERVI